MTAIIDRRCGGSPQSHVRKATVAMLCAVAVVGSLTACSEARSSGAPPTVVCGTTLWSGAEGAIVQNVSHGGAVTQVSAGGDLFLRVSNTCTTGVTVQVRPSSAARVITTAPSQDGRVSAVVLAPQRGSFTIRLDPAQGKAKIVSVNVAELPPAFSHSPTSSRTS